MVYFSWQFWVTDPSWQGSHSPRNLKQLVISHQHLGAKRQMQAFLVLNCLFLVLCSLGPQTREWCCLLSAYAFLYLFRQSRHCPTDDFTGQPLSRQSLSEICFFLLPVHHIHGWSPGCLFRRPASPFFLYRVPDQHCLTYVGVGDAPADVLAPW